jgi:diaminopimelate epimerase
MRITKQILKNDPVIEQVGFWVAPRRKDADARLEMSGGEFCGNALRALGGIIFLQNKKSLLFLESSGTREIVQVNVSKKISTITLPLKGFIYQSSVCSLPGISYVFASTKITKDDALFMLEKNDLIKLQASGVIGCKKTQDGFTIKPIVWVRDVATLFEETACGSGTMALAFSKFIDDKTKRLSIKQPSGYIFSTRISKGLIRLIGPVVSIETQSISLK